MKLISRLPEVRGSYRENEPLAKYTWLRVGGPAEVFYKPADQADLINFLRRIPKDIPVHIMGLGSNLLVRDGGVEGVVIRLGRTFAGIESDDLCLKAGAAALSRQVAEHAAREGVAGLGFLVGVPGSVGGALRMNAGAHGEEIKDCLLWAEAVSPKGDLVRLSNEELGYGYRTCSLPEGYIFTSACFKGFSEKPERLLRELDSIRQKRESSQPIREKTGGSTFKNPKEASAWELLDSAGLRGRKLGGAQVSELHCNFLINREEASARDLEDLGELMRKLVKEKSGIALEWEIQRWGKA